MHFILFQLHEFEDSHIMISDKNINVHITQYKMTRTLNAENPRTSREAKILLAGAVEAGNFEAAEKYFQDYHDLLNFEDEMHLGNRVADYFDENQVISTKYNANCQKYEKQIQNKIEKAKKLYTKKFEILKQQQELEIMQLVEEWQNQREESNKAAISDYQQSLVTARLVAGQNKFKEAAAIKEKTTKFRAAETTKINARFDLHYETQLKLMQKRHQLQLNQLIKEKHSELNTLQAMLEEAPVLATDCFNVENAQKVVQVTQKFKTSRRVPLSLAMQTVHGTRLEPEQKYRGKIDAGYKNKMTTMTNTLRSPINHMKK